MATVTRISVVPCMPEINSETRQEPTGAATLPYQHAASNKISRLLAKFCMKSHHLPVKKTTQGKVGLRTTAVLYHTVWMWGVCVSQPGVQKPDARSTQGTFSWASQRIWL